MAILRVKGTPWCDGEGDAKTIRTWRETVFVHTDTHFDTVPEILLSPLVPQIGNVHPKDPDAKVIRVRPRRSDAARLFRLEVEYSTATEDIEVQNPLDEPAHLDWTDETITEPAEFDDDGNWVCPTTILEPYDPLPEREVGCERLTVTRNVELWDETRRLFLRDFRKAVNSDLFFGYEPGWVKCDSIQGKQTEKNGIIFTAETLVFLFRAPRLKGVLIVEASAPEVPPQIGDVLGWETAVPDMGQVYIDSNGNAQPFMTRPGVPRSRPGLLNGLGMQLASGQPVVYKRFRLRKAKPFGELKIEGSDQVRDEVEP